MKAYGVPGERRKRPRSGKRNTEETVVGLSEERKYKVGEEESV